MIALLAGALAASCSAAATAVDVGLVASGVAGLGATGAVLNGRGSRVGDGMLVAGLGGAAASGVAGLALAARCGRARWGAIGGAGTAMAGLGAPLLVLGVRGWSANVQAGDDLELLWVAMAAEGFALLAGGVALNRLGRERLTVVPIDAGEAVGLGLAGRW